MSESGEEIKKAHKSVTWFLQRVQNPFAKYLKVDEKPVLPLWRSQLMIANHFRGKFWGDPLLDEVPIRNRKPTDGVPEMWISFIDRTLVKPKTLQLLESRDNARI